MTRGIRSSSAMMLSSTGIAESSPASSYHSVPGLSHELRELFKKKKSRKGRTQRVGLNTSQINVTTKVSRQVNKVSRLFNDGSAVSRFHPPCRFVDRGVAEKLFSWKNQRPASMKTQPKSSTHTQTYRATVAMTCKSLSSITALIFCTTGI